MLKGLFESCFEIEFPSISDDAFTVLPTGKGVVQFGRQRHADSAVIDG